MIVPVVVTYGNRRHFVLAVLERLLADPLVSSVVVVINGESDLTATDLTTAESAGTDAVVAVWNKKNRGSAGGYKDGLIAARPLVSNDDLFLLLDDDNLPHEGALALLAERATSGIEPKALLMNRVSRREIDRATSLRADIREARSSYAAFSAVGAITKRRKDPRGSTIGPATILAEFAPYGGLALNLAALDLIGLPNEDYYLYSDDHEFTNRVVRNGGTIELVEDAVLQDLEESWHLERRTLLPWFDPENPSLRVYYTIRNRTHYERAVLNDSNSVRNINMLAFWAAGCVDAMRLAFLGVSPLRLGRRFRTIFRAVGDGGNGRLGPAPSWRYAE